MLQQWLSKVVASPKTATGTASSLLDINQEVDLRATTELVKKYEDNWNSIRATDEINFHNASIADDLILQLLSICEEHFKTCELIKSEASQLRKITDIIEKATNSAISLKGKLSELDKMINEHEKANEVQIFEEWKKSEINLFNQFIDLKNEELKNKKDMYQEHYEEVIKIYHAQKIQSYQSDFEAQMNNYRKKIESSSPSYNEIIEKPEDDIIHNLEQVELETADDREALENFLESGSDDNGV